LGLIYALSQLPLRLVSPNLIVMQLALPLNQVLLQNVLVAGTIQAMLDLMPSILIFVVAVSAISMATVRGVNMYKYD
jgi:hypothetical protein